MTREDIFNAIINIICGIIIIASICLCVYFAFKPNEVQTVSQEVAETPTGVKIATEKAGYSLDDEQVTVVANRIKEIKETNEKPAYTITTTPQKVQKGVEQARKDNHADVAIVTNPEKPTEVVDLSRIEKDKTVELNQYNIKAYKPVLRTIEYGTDKVLTFSISKKVNDNGNYIGIGAGYDFDDKRIVAKVSYTW